MSHEPFREWSEDEIQEYLTKQGDPFDAIDHLERELSAATNSDAPTVRAILEKHPPFMHGMCLTIAVDNQDSEVVETMLRGGCDPDTRGEEGETPLMMAAANGDLSLAQMLLKHGASVDVTDGEGESLLDWAANGGSLEIVKLLLERRTPEADEIDAALVTAAELGYDKIHALLKSSASSQAVAEAESVYESGQRRKARRREPATDPATLKFLEAAGLGDVEGIQNGIEHGVDVNAVDDGGFCALTQVAMAADAPELTQMLLDAGADPNQQDEDGFTPLMMSVNADNLDALKLLLKFGADPNLRTEDDETALTLAIEQGEQTMISELLKHGADAEGRDISEMLQEAQHNMEEQRDGLLEMARAFAELAGDDESLQELSELEALAEETMPNLPPTITLQPASQISWDDPDEVEEYQQALTVSEFEQVGDFTIPELPNLFLQAFVNEGEDLYAVIYQHPDTGNWLDVVRMFEDDSSMTITNAVLGAELPDPPHMAKKRYPAAPASQLLSTAVNYSSDQPRRLLSAHAFRQDFENYYAEEMKWRNNQ